jgi:hypothetical protein
MTFIIIIKFNKKNKFDYFYQSYYMFKSIFENKWKSFVGLTYVYILGVINNLHKTKFYKLRSV